MPRKPRPLERDEHTLRDTNLVVIASEDKYAAKLYFDRLKAKRVQFKVLPTEDCRSSPEALVERLSAFKDEFQLGEGDELWYCGDIDHWADPNHCANLNRAMALCHQKGYFVALSNPCFELWLMLHFRDHTEAIGSSCSDIDQALRSVAKGYSKSRGCGEPITTTMIADAVRRAREMDREHDNPLPPAVATRVYRILENLVAHDQITLASNRS